jgi:phage terminase large subunit-like protein
MTNLELIKKLQAQTTSSLFAKYELEYKGIIPDKDFYEGCTELASYSFLAFVSACLKERFDLQPFHRLIAEIFEYVTIPISNVKRFIISAPPRAGKSMLTQYYVAWLCGLNPMTAHIFSSYGQRLSTKFMSKVALIMQSSEYEKCFPAFPGFLPGSNTIFKTGGSIFGTSVGGAITGMDAGTLDIVSVLSPGIAILDDPLKNGESEAEIEALEPYYVDEFATRRTGNWRQGLIATRFAINDLHAIVLGIDGLWDSTMNSTGWLYCNLSALCKDPDTDPLNREYNESIWPNHPTLNQAELLKLETKKLWRFNTVYQGNPTIQTSTLIKNINYPSVLLFNDIIKLHLVVDSASGSSEGSDNTSITICGIQQNIPIVLEQVSGNWNIIEIRKQIAFLLSKYTNIKSIAIENASTGLALIPDYENNTNGCNPKKLPVLKLSSQQMGGKVRRLMSVEDLIYLCKFSDSFIEYEDFRKELMSFPHGKKDDRVDSFVWSLIVLKPLLNLNIEEKNSDSLFGESEDLEILTENSWFGSDFTQEN